MLIDSLYGRNMHGGWKNIVGGLSFIDIIIGMNFTISAPPTRVEHCDDKPPNGSLAQTMVWDLGLNCREEILESGAITGYRVFYRWDDRVYSQVMAAAPGSTIPLKIRIN